MSPLSRKIAAALDARQDPGALPCEVAAEDGGRRLSLSLTACGPVGLAFDTLTFSAEARSGSSPEALKAWANALAARVTYLMEPLVVLEQDEVAGEVELRSQAPTARGERRSYYEVRLNRDGTLRMSRVAFDESARRRAHAPSQMTREVIERLADDLVATAG